jgi:MSHA biogenesis protein MshP
MWTTRPEGFAIVSALFLITALAVLGAAIMHFSATQHVTGAQDIQGSRALAAARAGADWQVRKIHAEESANNPQYACGPAANFSFGDFALNVSCTHSDHDEEGNKVRVYNITAIASSSGGSPGALGFVERRFDLVVATCRKTLNGALC